MVESKSEARNGQNKKYANVLGQILSSSNNAEMIKDKTYRNSHWPQLA